MIKNQKGVAILIVMMAIMMMSFLAIEIGYNSHVELAVGVSQMDRLKAYYLAKSGIQISLLRIQVYRMVISKFGAQLGGGKSALDIIWQFPFSWPPMVPPDISDFDKDTINTAVKKSIIDGSFVTGIEGEGGKIDINDLGSPSKLLRDATNAQLVQIIENRLTQDDDWARDNRSIKPQEIVNNIADWVSEGTTSLNGGSKDSPYAGTNPPIKPPMRSMKTLEELHMVKGITDELYKILAPRVTVYGVKGINVNLASLEVLKSIDPQITDEIAKKIIERRSDPNQGPFQNLQDFQSFVQAKGIYPDNFNKKPPIPLLFDSEYNFRIRSTGLYRKATREIFAIVYDFDKVKGQLAQYLASPTPSGSQAPGQAGASPSPSGAAAGGGGATTVPKGPPQVVFWQED